LAVAACSNHVEGMHGRLNALIRPFRGLSVRCAELIAVIIKSPGI
jgi:hypothetical protein